MASRSGLARSTTTARTSGIRHSSTHWMVAMAGSIANAMAQHAPTGVARSARQRTSVREFASVMRSKQCTGPAERSLFGRSAYVEWPQLVPCRLNRRCISATRAQPRRSFSTDGGDRFSRDVFDAAEQAAEHIDQRGPCIGGRPGARRDKVGEPYQHAAVFFLLHSESPGLHRYRAHPSPWDRSSQHQRGRHA